MGDILDWHQFITCLLNGRHKAALKNYGKIQDVIQDKQRKNSQFLDLLTKAKFQYISLDPETPYGLLLLPEFPQH